VTGHPARILVLGLGNDILGDDAVGLVAARRLRAALPAAVDVLEQAGASLDLLDILEPYDRALILDSIVTGQHPPGTILEFDRTDFQEVLGPSPHYAGLPEVLRLAEALGIPFPAEIRILACEVADPYELREGISASLTLVLPTYVSRAQDIVDAWHGLSSADASPA
jgi:hydrogenase maturation protease